MIPSVCRYTFHEDSMMCSDIIKNHLYCLYMTIYFYWKIVRYFKMKIFILERVLNSCKSIDLTGSQDVWFIDSLTPFVGTLNSARDWFDSFEMRFYAEFALKESAIISWQVEFSLSHRSRCMCVWAHQEHEHKQVWVKVQGLQEQVGQIGSQFLSESGLFSWQQQQPERNLKGMIGSIQEVYFQDRIAVVMFLAQQSNSQKKRPEPQITVKQYLWQAGLDWMCSASETGPLNSSGLSL